MKLTKPMTRHLEILSWSDDERGAYPGLSLTTLNALEKRGLVKSRHTLGSIAMPHTAIKWRLTDAGRTALFGRD